MSANDVDFGIAFRKARADYDRHIRDELRAVFDLMDPVVRDNISRDENLEEQIRAYVIDPLLEALNWRIGKNIIVEAFVRSQQTNKRRRLDYLGHEGDTPRPLFSRGGQAAGRAVPERNANHRGRPQLYVQGLVGGNAPSS